MIEDALYLELAVPMWQEFWGAKPRGWRQPGGCWSRRRHLGYFNSAYIHLEAGWMFQCNSNNSNSASYSNHS